MENKLIYLKPATIGTSSMIVPSDAWNWKILLESLETQVLVDLTAIDWLNNPEANHRFSLVAIISNKRDDRITIRIDLQKPEFQSLSTIIPAANFLEREIFDLMGISFIGHHDLRRLLTDYGFTGHPLRKDYPTVGYTEIFYSTSEKGIVPRAVYMNQEYRTLKLKSQWISEQ